MSGWVDVYPLDECTAYYREEIEQLYAAATYASTGANNARQLLASSVAVADTNSACAPMTYPFLSNALYGAAVGPAGLTNLATVSTALVDSLHNAREVYAEAEWTLTRTMNDSAAFGPIRNGVGWRMPFVSEWTDRVQLAGIMALMLRRLNEGMDGPGAAQVQGEMRELGARLRELLGDGARDVRVETRDGPQYLADRGPVQGAALLMLAWANLAELAQTVTVRQVPAVGAPTDEMDTAKIESIEGIPSALEWISATRTLSDEVGRIAVVSHQLADGTTAWTVLIPGTQALMGGQNPQDWESNLELTAGLSSELMAAVLAAMRAAPIQPGQTVTLVGHSQGGIVAVALASNEEVNKEFTIRGVVTAGAPVGQFNMLPSSVRSLHLEDINDVVPTVDGLANTASQEHVTLVFDRGTMAPYPHGHENYADLVETVLEQGNSPQLERLAAEIGDGAGWQAGGEARLYSFEFERDETSPKLYDILARKAVEAIG